MVLTHNLKDVYEASCKLSTFSLPVFKGNQLSLQFSDVNDVITVYSGSEPCLPFAASDILQASIIDWRRLTATYEGCKAVYEISLNFKDSNLCFKPGDTIGIIPCNEQREVEEIIEHLNIKSRVDLEYNLSVVQKSVKIPPHVPIKSTLRHVLTSCCDIRSVLKKLFLLALSRYTKDEKERRILEYLCSKEGSSAYNTYVLNKHLNILNLFDIFKSCKPPIEVLLAYLPRLLPRPYSIVNSGVNNSNELRICFSVIDLGNNSKGLVTGWLERLILEEKKTMLDKMEKLNISDDIENVKIPFYFRKNMSGFSPPEDLGIPMILIGPGTGVAPFIGFLEERQYYKEKYPERKLGDIWIFFGCRNPQLDYIYEKEMCIYLNNGTLSKLSTSFSRIENNENKYIQDALMQKGNDVIKLIKEGASIFVCGDLKNIATQVKETLVNCLVKYDSKSQQEAEKLLSDMQTGKRFLVDMWS